MTDPKETGKPEVKTREVKKKVSSGIFDNLRKLPEPHPVEEILGLAPSQEQATPSTGSIPPTPSRDSSPSTARRGSTGSTPSTRRSRQPVAPERDYTRVANSIVREAVPSGIFGENGGKSKQLYDYLYSQTRGAVVPQRKVRIPKDKLMRKAGIGSEVTLRKNLLRLRSCGLVKESIVGGAHGGNEYEVFLPEEVGLEISATPSTPPSPPTVPSSRQTQEGVEPLEDRGSSTGVSDVSTTAFGEDKTSSLIPSRTIDDDDAALVGLMAILKQGAKDITGKAPSASEAERWRELGEVLVTELKIAAARTSVSSVPSFFAEHLRRRLFKKDSREMAAEVADSPTPYASSAPQLSPEEINRCPDCGGSSWRRVDPNEPAKGVVRCKHDRLRLQETS